MCTYIVYAYYHQVPILARASHFGYEHASHEIFREIICSHTWINIFLFMSNNVVSIDRVCELILMVRSRKVAESFLGSTFHLNVPKLSIELMKSLYELFMTPGESGAVAANSKTAVVLEQRARGSKTPRCSSSTVHSVQLKLKQLMF